MPDNLAPQPAGLEPAIPEAPPSQDRPKRRTRSLKIDREAVVDYVLKHLDRDLQDREQWMRMRLERYAKMRGWLPEKVDPIGNLSSNVWLPVILAASLRVKATLENAIRSTRPLMESKARKRVDFDKQYRVDRLLDYQVFSEANGDRVFDDLISNYVDDGTAVAFQRWVKRTDTIYDVKVLDPRKFGEQRPADDGAMFFEFLKILFPEIVDAKPRGPSDQLYTWMVTFLEQDQPKIAIVDFYDTDDGRIEAHIKRKVETYNGPAIEVQDLEDIVVPLRSSNLQPPGAENPHGAPYVFRLCTARMDEIRRRAKDGTYDMLSDEDVDAIDASKSAVSYGSFPSAHNEDAMKEERDRQEGISPSHSHDYDPKQVVEAYMRWDVDDDGEEEDVIFWIARDSRKLLRARMLTEIYPGLPVRRPFSETRLFPVPNRFYGISLPEILESIQDSMKALMDQNIDWGTITNAPFGFYRASSSITPEIIKLLPGELYPLDDPTADVNFPTWNRDQSWAINTLQILNQWQEKLAMQSDTSFGRVPQGKASALRTAGTTQALLAQTDVRSEQVLRRLFDAIAQIYGGIHRLNRHYLPRGKEFRIVGMPEQGEDVYMEVSPDEIDFDVEFDFKASLLNANKEALGQTLMEVGQLILSPIAIQIGAVSAEEMYNYLRDVLRARDLDPDRYLKRPPMLGPKILAEEAIGEILEGKMPTGVPLENPQEHLQKLMAFQASDEFGLLTQPQMEIYQSYTQQLMQTIQEMAQQQMMLSAAAQTQSGMQGGAPPGGAQQTVAHPAEPTPVHNGEMIDEQASMPGIT